MKRFFVCAAVFLFAAVGGWMLPAPEAAARPAESHTTNYYTGATMSELVGQRSIDCYGHLTAWGVETEYIEVFSFSCNPWPGGELEP